MVKLLVFDWDGTLADSGALIVNTMQAAIRNLSLEPRSNQSILDIIGLGLTEAAASLYPDLAPGMHTELADQYRMHYRLSAIGKTSLFPDVKPTLCILRDQGYHLAIATGKSRRGLDNSLQETGIADFFAVTRCADETLSKPHPQMLLEVVDTLAVEPECTLMIGDSEHDMQMARNAGINAIAVSYGTQHREKLATYIPLTVLDRLQDLPSWLASYQPG